MESMETIRGMKTDELHSELDRIRRHLFDLRSQAVTEKLEDPTQLGKTKREIEQVPPISSKPLETRMGKGKGEPDHWAAVVKPGTVLYELAGISEDAARICLARVAHKMPVRCRFMSRRLSV